MISDIHHKVAKADAIIAHEPHDQVIFLGDVFDDFGDVPEDAHRSATWLKASLDKPGHLHLAGNHDVSYAYSSNPFTRCSGWERPKDYITWQVMDRTAFDKLAFYLIQDGIMFSHAGLSAKLLKKQALGAIKTLDETMDWLRTEHPKARAQAENDGNHWMYGAGWSRGGRETYGGLTWCDFDLDFLATSFPQIVGHTPHPHPLFHLRQPNGSKVEVKRASETTPEDLKTNWWALDLDSHLDHYAVIDNGKLTVKEIMWSGRGRDVNRSFEVFEGQI